jgi:hypothetical protein
MPLLSAFLGRLLKRPVWSEVTNTHERRSDERQSAFIPVLIGLRGQPPLAGSVINISLNGAAIRINEWNAAWLISLDQSDEMWLAGLLEVPVICWVVIVEKDVIRVHFAWDHEFRNQLQELIGKLIPM